MDAHFVEHARLHGWSAPALDEAKPTRLRDTLDRAEGTDAGQ
ncbi:hypothetical protein [Streptomyces dubilierae]|uniref:Uncharacterized protein n=1 Tax=Streptomyces dubilierae TaxID=3075533 RepID=A0ABU2PES3_9ACTN|nr:hypothetical protein [Streptomyces sp. DSM 41921]MDT0390662.1 hypothetical protein [Streptomyces sp. DSM 41921]